MVLEMSTGGLLVSAVVGAIVTAVLVLFFPVVWRYVAHCSHSNASSTHTARRGMSKGSSAKLHKRDVDLEPTHELRRGEFDYLETGQQPAPQRCTVVLTNESVKVLVLQQSGQDTSKNATEEAKVLASAQLEDVAGVRVGEDGLTLHIFVFPKSAKKKNKRGHQVIQLRCTTTHEDSLSWERALLDALHHQQPDGSPRKFLVFINPIAGQKKGAAVWAKAKKVFDVASGAEITEIVTRYSGHAADVVRTFDFTGFTGVVAVSGDGLIFEILNAMLSRDDCGTLLNTVALGTIPAGSGNGLAASCGLMHDPLGVALKIIKGRKRPLDVLSMQQGNKFVYSFLQISFGFISDCDFGSEKLRWMGESRYDLYAVWLFFCRYNYNCRLTLYIDKNTDPNTENAVLCSRHDYFPHYHLQKSCEDNHGCLCCCRLNDECRTLSRQRFLELTRAPKVVPHSPSHSADAGAPQIERELDNLNKMVLEEPFNWILGSNVTHIAGALNSGPFAHLSDGLVDMTVIRKRNYHWRDMLMLLLTLDTGGIHTYKPTMEYFKVPAFDLEVLPDSQTSGSVIDVDGERFPCTPKIRVRVHQGLCMMMC